MVWQLINERGSSTMQVLLRSELSEPHTSLHITSGFENQRGLYLRKTNAVGDQDTALKGFAHHPSPSAETAVQEALESYREDLN